MSKKLELRPTKTHHVTMPTNKALEYIAALKDYANAKLPDPGFAIALSMAINCMSRAASEAAEPLTLERKERKSAPASNAVVRLAAYEDAIPFDALPMSRSCYKRTKRGGG